MDAIHIAFMTLAGIAIGGTTATSMDDGFGVQIEEMRRQANINTAAIQENIKVIHFDQQGSTLNIILSNYGNSNVEISEIIDGNYNNADCGSTNKTILAGEKMAISCITQDSIENKLHTQSNSAIEQNIKLYMITTSNKILKII